MLRTTVSQTMRQFNRNMSAIKCRRLEGRVAIVTASTEGIGFAIARRLAEEGAKVMVSSRRDTNVEKAVEQLKSEGLDVSGTVCHVSKKEDRKSLFEKTIQEFGGLDILVSNAAVNPIMTTFMETPEDTWEKIFDVNVKSTFLLLQESVPFLKKSKSPSIIIISSIGAYKPLDLLGAYSVSKTALLGVNKVASSALLSEGIRVNSIAPGIINTKFSKVLCEGEASEASLSMIPMRRFGEPSDVAGVAAFLASDDASYITGETIAVSGGIRSRL